MHRSRCAHVGARLLEQEVDFFGIGLAVTPFAFSLQQDLLALQFAAAVFGLFALAGLYGLKRIWRLLVHAPQNPARDVAAQGASCCVHLHSRM